MGYYKEIALRRSSLPPTMHDEACRCWECKEDRRLARQGPWNHTEPQYHARITYRKPSGELCIMNVIDTAYEVLMHERMLTNEHWCCSIVSVERHVPNSERRIQ